MGLSAKDIAFLGPSAQKQILSQLKTKPSSKYQNQPTQIKSVKFASKKEAARYASLLLLLDAKVIRNLKLQPQFTL